MTDSFSTIGCPSTTSPMSNDVPPMSVVTTLECPFAAASAAAPVRPAVGPESRVPRAISDSAEAGTTPPLDCMTSSGARSPSAARRPAIEARYRVHAGPTYPLSTDATVRSYSPRRGDTREDSETKTSGATVRTIFSTACSWSGLANDHRSATATLSS
jgi:hypothetical protein